MTVDATRLYELMPAVYRVRDAAEQQTLEDLVDGHRLGAN